MTDPFEFVDAGRLFQCSVGTMHKTSPDVWWWFKVSSDPNARYAPFRVQPGETQAEVQARIVGYYDNMLARRAEPPVKRWQRGAPPPKAAVPAPDSGPVASA